MEWIDVKDKLPEEYDDYLVIFKGIHGDNLICVASYLKVSQHNFENTPYHNTWFVFPSGGHRLRTVTHWMPLPTTSHI